MDWVPPRFPRDTIFECLQAACKFLSSKGISVSRFRKCKCDMLQLPCTLWDMFSYSWTMPVGQARRTERHKLYIIVKKTAWAGEVRVYHQPQLYSNDGEFCISVFASLITLLVVDMTMVSECKRTVCRKGMGRCIPWSKRLVGNHNLVLKLELKRLLKMCRCAKFSHIAILSWMQNLHVLTKDSPTETDSNTVPSFITALLHV